MSKTHHITQQGELEGQPARLSTELDQDFIDGNEACRLLGVKPATLYAYVSRGILKSYKQGIKRQRLYRRSEIENLLIVRPSDTPPPVQAENPETKEKDSDIPAAEDWIPYF